MTSGGSGEEVERSLSFPDQLDSDGASIESAGTESAGVESAATRSTAPFENEAIVVPGIPTLDADTFSMLDPRYRTLRVVTAGVGGAVPVLAAVAVSVAMSLPGVLEASGVGAAALLWVIRVVFAWFEYPYLGWLLRAHDVSFRRGIIGRSTTTVPFSRVQHVAVSRSGISRVFGLASVDLFTAGSGIADLSIPGLDLSVAERLREHVLTVTRGGAG